MNYKVLDDIAAELSTKLRTQQQQDLLTEMWKPYIKELDTMYADATCYESERRYPTDPKLVWESTEKAYVIICEMSGRLKEHRPRTKYLDVEKATWRTRSSANTVSLRHAGCSAESWNCWARC